MYGDLKEYTKYEYPDSVFFVKGKKVHMFKDLKTNDLFVNYDTIWSDLKTIFGLEGSEIKRIISKWVEETYKLKGVTPEWSGWCKHIMVEETYKLNS